MKKLLATLGLPTAACAIGLFACGAPDSGASATTDQSATSCGATEPAPASVTARPVSFAADVLPIFVASCSFGSCHGAAKGDNHGVFLGAKSSANDAAAIRASLVDKPSTQSPSTPYVTPSDPARSYLYRKLTGDLCGITECGSDGAACGRRMPRGGEQLDAASLEIVRTWIVQGASAD